MDFQNYFWKPARSAGLPLQFLTAGKFLPKPQRTHNRIADQTASSRHKYCDGKKLGFLLLSHGFGAIAWLISDRLFAPTLNGFGPIHTLVAGLQDLLQHRPDVLGSSMDFFYHHIHLRDWFSSVFDLFRRCIHVSDMSPRLV